MLLSQAIKKEMKKRNLTYEDIAEASGLSYMKVRSFALSTVPKAKDLEIICDALGIDPDTLVFKELNISVDECAKTMQKSTNFVKNMVRKGVFGFHDGATYHIPRAKFEQYMGMIDANLIDNVVDEMFRRFKEQLTKEKVDATTSTNQ